MNNSSKETHQKATPQSSDIGMITNDFDSSILFAVSPPCYRAAKLSSTSGHPDKNTNLVIDKMHAENPRIATSCMKKSNIPIIENAPKNVCCGADRDLALTHRLSVSDRCNVTGEPVDADGTGVFGRIEDKDLLVEQMRQLESQRISELLKNKKKLEEKLEMMTHQNVKTSFGSRDVSKETSSNR